MPGPRKATATRRIIICILLHLLRWSELMLCMRLSAYLMLLVAMAMAKTMAATRGSTTNARARQSVLQIITCRFLFMLRLSVLLLLCCSMMIF